MGGGRTQQGEFDSASHCVRPAQYTTGSFHPSVNDVSRFALVSLEFLCLCEFSRCTCQNLIFSCSSAICHLNYPISQKNLERKKENYFFSSTVSHNFPPLHRMFYSHSDKTGPFTPRGNNLLKIINIPALPCALPAPAPLTTTTYSFAVFIVCLALLEGPLRGAGGSKCAFQGRIPSTQNNV